MQGQRVTGNNQAALVDNAGKLPQAVAAAAVRNAGEAGQPGVFIHLLGPAEQQHLMSVAASFSMRLLSPFKRQTLHLPARAASGIDADYGPRGVKPKVHHQVPAAAVLLFGYIILGGMKACGRKPAQLQKYLLV